MRSDSRGIRPQSGAKSRVSDPAQPEEYGQNTDAEANPAGDGTGGPPADGLLRVGGVVVDGEASAISVLLDTVQRSRFGPMASRATAPITRRTTDEVSILNLGFMTRDRHPRAPAFVLLRAAAQIHSLRGSPVPFPTCIKESIEGKQCEEKANKDEEDVERDSVLRHGTPSLLIPPPA